MELTNQEQLLIEALREMDEPPANILLWYQAGLEQGYEKAEKVWGKGHMRLDSDIRKIETAKKYQRLMD